MVPGLSDFWGFSLVRHNQTRKGNAESLQKPVHIQECILQHWCSVFPSSRIVHGMLIQNTGIRSL